MLGQCQVDTGQTLVPPEDPVCYTPCRGGPGCSEEGVKAGCIQGLECVDGTCIAPSDKAAKETKKSKKGTCKSDAQCPDFQACIQGRCYSDCEQDSDCRKDRKCIRKVCRLPCKAADSECAPGTTCELVDGVTGYCKPVAAPGEPIEAPSGAFTIVSENELTNHLTFTNAKTSGSFAIQNDTDATQSFSIRKVEHRAFGAVDSETETEDPLNWVKLAAEGVPPTTDREILVSVPPQESLSIEISDAAGDWQRWDGHLTVSSVNLGEVDVGLSYKAGKEGRWSGNMYFLAGNFGEEGLAEWLMNKQSATATAVVGNAFIQRWTAFRDNKLDYIDFRSMLTATEEGSWQWQSVRQRCPRPGAPNPLVGCYMANNPDGVAVYSSSLEDFPIPTGVSKLPIAMNLHADEDDGPLVWSGKIVSRETLHYPGDPAVRLAFASDPKACDGEGETCKTLLSEFASTITVGGRYPTTRTGSCAPGFTKVQTPWLVAGFEAGTSLEGSRRIRYECRNQNLPLGSGMDVADLNANAAGANPIPDGASRARQLELIDGAMIGGDTLFIIFRESMPSFIDPASGQVQRGYGYMLLQPTATDLGDDPFTGNSQMDSTAAPSLPEVGCSSDILAKIAEAQGGSSVELDGSTAADIGTAVVAGVAADLGSPIPPAEVHFYCADDSLFDTEDCAAAARTYFVAASTTDAITAEEIAALACMGMGAGGCLQQFNDWLTDEFIVEPLFTCPTAAACVPTEFYRVGAGTPAFAPLTEAISDAFAYKSQFTSMRGSVGFAPTPCDGSSPYCYDAATIEEIVRRVDCATHIYTTYYDDISTTPALNVIKGYLTENFGWAGASGNEAGFERLYAQLLIMLGDDAYASTFTTRFDLSGELTNATFEGNLFEPGGSSFTGPAGFEMNSLYRAAQYYQAVLDRFFSQAKAFKASLNDLPAGQGFITQGTASAYVERLLLASSQKSRAWTEVAKRYQSFNDARLAARILGRAGAGAYLESVVLSDLLDDLSAGAPDTAKKELVRQLEQAQRTYSVALLDMNTANRQITDEITVFGFAPDYVPFPVVHMKRYPTAFAQAFARAKEKMEEARAKEEQAIADAKNYAGSEAEFFQQLANINTDYETQLADLCGTFEANGVGYPAIPQYASLTPRTQALADPCGFVGNGAINDALLALEQTRLDVAAVAQQRSNLEAAIAGANALAQEQCDSIEDLRDLKIGLDTTKATLGAVQRGLNIAIDRTEKALGVVSQLTELSKCEPPGPMSAGDCASGAVSSGVYVAAATTALTTTTALQATVLGIEAAKDAIDIGLAAAEFNQRCEAIEIDTAYKVRDLYRRGLDLTIEATKAQLAVQQTMSQVLKLRNDANITMATWEQSKAYAIDVAAAWNDPNVRIYKNDAIINAERTFNAAVREAYVATKVYEYFTSQSYAPLEKLYLVRMVQYGTPNLEQYLTELEEAFLSFQQTYGSAQSRVMVLSLVDDILGLSELGPDNAALTKEDRRSKLRELLAGSDYRDGNGRLVFPFSTVLDKVSPQTLNHKIQRIEAEIVPQIGDNQARLYLVQRGTGVVKNTEATLNHYSLPLRQAVLDTFFAGQKPLGDSVYENTTFEDRPLINTGWQLVFDPQAESVNRDVDLGTLDDIRLYLYYQDFTAQ